jgi:hypothetical protein
VNIVGGKICCGYGEEEYGRVAADDADNADFRRSEEEID